MKGPNANLKSFEAVARTLLMSAGTVTCTVKSRSGGMVR